LASLTVENYVKTIFKICQQDGVRLATTGRLASALSVSPGTVTSMLKSLSEAGLATYTPYEGVQLTDVGSELALTILRRHRLIESFLARVLDLGWDEIHEDAEQLEHAVSERLIARIDAFLGEPHFDPHGDPIPRADGSLPRRPLQNLSEFPLGESFELAQVSDQSPDFLRYLGSSGFSLGCRGEVIASRPEAGIVTVRLGDQEISLGTEAAQKVLVCAPEAAVDLVPPATSDSTSSSVPAPHMRPSSTRTPH